MTFIFSGDCGYKRESIDIWGLSKRSRKKAFYEESKTMNQYKKLLQDGALFGVIIFLAFVFSFQCSNNLFHTGNVFTDSSVFKYVARVIENGGMPYRDTFDHKGPLIYIINLVGLKIGEWRGTWVVEFAALFITFVAMYKTAYLKSKSRTLSLAVLLFSGSALFKYFQGGNLTEEYAIPFIAVSIYFFTDLFLNNKITNVRLIVGGVSLGAVCLLRLNMIPIWVVMCIGFLALCIKQHDYKHLSRFIILFSVGFLIAVLPILVWLINGDAFISFIKDYWHFNRLYAMHVDWTQRCMSFVHFYNDTIFMLVLAAQVYLVLKYKNKYDVLYLAYFLLTLLMIALSGHIYMHYGMIIVPALVHPITCIAQEMLEKDKNQLVTKIVIVLVVICIAMPQWNNAATKMLKDFSTRKVNHIDSWHRKVAEFIKNNSDTDDKITVCGNDDMYYNLSGRFSASRFSYTLPLFTVNNNYRNEFYNDIEKTKPKVIILPNSYYDYKAMMDYIQKNNYETVTSLKSKNISVYIKK